MLYPTKISFELKNEHSEHLLNITTEAIRHYLQKDLDLLSCHATENSMLIAAMEKKRRDFCKNY